MSEAFRQVLENKEQIVRNLQDQILKQKRIMDSTIDLRQQNERDITLKSRDIENAKKKVQLQKMLVESKRKDPIKQAKIQQLQKINRDMASKYEQKLLECDQKRQDLYKHLENKVKLENKNLFNTQTLQKHTLDLEDKDYIEQKIEQSAGQIKILYDQQVKLVKQIEKKQAGKVVDAQCEDVDKSIQQMLKVNQFEKQANLTHQWMTQAQVQIRKMIEEYNKVWAQAISQQGRLYITLGKNKEQSKGTLYFLIKQFLLESKAANMRKNFEIDLSQLRNLMNAFAESLQNFHSLDMDLITDNDLELAYQLDKECNNWKAVCQNNLNEGQKYLSVIQKQVHLYLENLRLRCSSEIKVRLQILDNDNSEGLTRSDRVSQTLHQFDKELMRLLLIGKLNYRADDFKDLRKTVKQLQDDGYELAANYQITQNVLQKSRVSTKNIDSFTLTSIEKIIKQLNEFEKSILRDNIRMLQLEQRVKELQVNFNNLIRQISEETQEHLNRQLNERSKQADEIQKKDKELLNLIEGRKSDLFNIKNQINEDDKELQSLFQTNEQDLFEAGGDEEQASQQHRQILNKTDNLMKQFKQMDSVDLNQFEKAHDLFQQLDEMDSFIFDTEQKIEEGFQKANNLQENLKDLEKRLRNQRINECESYLKITFESIEQLNSLIEKLNTQVSVIQKDQNQLLNNDGFADQEKRKEISSFSSELQKKSQDLQTFTDAKDQLRYQIEVLEKDFQNKLREKGLSSDQNTESSKDGKEFLKIKQNAEKIKDDISRQIQLVDGEVNEDIQICREVNVKMIKKYKNKKDLYIKSIDLRSQKQDDFKEHNSKISGLNSRQNQLLESLKNLGISSQDQNIDQLQKFMQRIKSSKDRLDQIQKQIENYSVKIRNEAQDIDFVDQKIVKSIKIDDIYKMLNELKISSEAFDDNLEQLDLQLKIIEKEVEAFMIKTRSSQLFDCESKLNNLYNSIQKLINKIQHVNIDLNSFNDELSSNSSSIQNINKIHEELDQFTHDLGLIDIDKDNYVQQLELLKSKLALLDKKNLSIQDCNQISYDASSVEELCIIDYSKAQEIQDKLHKLVQQYRDQSKFENDRQSLIIKAKIKLNDNLTMLAKMKKLLVSNNDKIGEFDTLYKAMNTSEDFHSKKPIIEKKLRRMSQFKVDCGKFNEDQEKLKQQLEGPLSLTEEDLENITDLDQLQKFIESNENQSQLLQVNVKELSDMNQNFEKRRRKVADAEVRKLSTQRLKELEGVRDNLIVQMNKLNDFERQLQERELDNSHDPLSPEKQSHLQKTLIEFKSQFQTFKEQFDKVEHEIKNINLEVSSKNLEQEVSLPELAQEIERLRKKTFEVKDLNFELDKIQIELQAKSTLLSSLDTEKRLKNLLTEIANAEENNDQISEALLRIQDLSKSYDGYTSSAQDEEFYTVLHSESRDLFSDLNHQSSSFSDFVKDIQRMQAHIDKKKDESGGNLISEDVDNINEQIARLEMKVGKTRKQREELESIAFGNKQKMAFHDVEMKLQRRKQEIEELEKIIGDINNDNQSIKERIAKEIEACQDDPKFNNYIQKLQTILQNTQIIEEKASDIHKQKIDIDFDVDQAITDLGNNSHDVNQRLLSLDQNLVLKKQIQATLKQISQLHTSLKTLFASTNEAFSKKPQEPIFKPPPGADEVDKMLAEILNRLGINIPIKKLGGGYYLFGTKKIYCKIINGKLVVRVGGGYMGIEEFIVQYGQAELEKVNNQALLEAKMKEHNEGNSGKGLHAKMSGNLKDVGASNSNPQSSISLKLAIQKTGLSNKGALQMAQSPKTNRSEVEDNTSVGNMGSVAGSATNQSLTKTGAHSKANFQQFSDKGNNQDAISNKSSTNNSKAVIKKSGSQIMKK